MLSLVRSSIELVEVEEAIVNSNPFYNAVSKDKETFTTEEVAEEIANANHIGAERFLIKHDNEYVGILEYILCNPNDQSPWLGLLMIKKEHQAQGYGLKALELFNEEMRAKGIRKYRIGVFSENEPGHKFWSKHGFIRIDSTINEDRKEIIIYEKNLNTFIYFVRHAISPFSLDNERSRGLSEQGKSDSIRVAEILQSEGIDVVASSTFARAVDTVRPLAELLNKEIIPFEELVERPIASLKVEIGEDELLKAIDQSFIDIDFCLLEGESTRQAQERSIPAIKQLLTDYEGKKIAIGTHGNIMTIILNYFDNSYGYDFWTQTSKPDVYKLEFDGTRLVQVERLWNANS